MYRLRSQYMECMDCNAQTIDEGDYQAMLKWLNKNNMQPGIDPLSAEIINYELFQQWIKLKSSSKQ